MGDLKTYFYKKMPDENLSIEIFLKENMEQGGSFKKHWHEHLQIYYIIEGKAMIECGHRSFDVSPGSIAIVNGNELHYLESLSDNLRFYVIRIDPTFLFSNQVDLLQTKYLAPLAQNRIAFQNSIENDPQMSECILEMIDEYLKKQVGYELAVKALSYQLIVLLLRGYVEKIMTKNESDEKMHSLKRFEAALRFIENNYTEAILLSELADSVNLSICHFCRTFKQITGKTTTKYINGVRLERAAALLLQKDLNITEIALRCGFDSVNYFSRLFRKYYSISPTKYRESNE